ncbi:MAG TPA: hypothetical protein VGH02_09580 [Rhizomicrobium sp.]|jgi:hypothetical protein
MTPEEEDERARDRMNRIVLLVAVAIVAVGLFLLWLMNHYQQQENCRIERRRDCGDAIAVPNS